MQAVAFSPCEEFLASVGALCSCAVSLLLSQACVYSHRPWPAGGPDDSALVSEPSLIGRTSTHTCHTLRLLLYTRQINKHSIGIQHISYECS